MKYLLFPFLLLAFFACEKDSSSGIVGTWHLDAIYSDPGDGSGDFVPVDSGLQIEFRADGTYTSNGTLCDLSGENGGASTGSYNSETSAITPNNCEFSSRVPTYETTEGQLIIWMPCIEACGLRFDKVD